MANLLPSSRKPASHRRPVFNLPTASMKRKPSSKPGLEPLRLEIVGEVAPQNPFQLMNPQPSFALGAGRPNTNMTDFLEKDVLLRMVPEIRKTAGLEEGDDVNLASECEDNPGQFPAKPSKANNEAATSPMPKARGKQSNATQTLSKATSKNESSSVNESQGKINQVCLITIIVILLLMLIATSTTTVVVILHWSGKVTWVPALSKALHG